MLTMQRVCSCTNQIPLGTIFDISFVYNNVPVAEPKPLISQDVHFTIHIK